MLQVTSLRARGMFVSSFFRCFFDGVGDKDRAR